MPRPDSSKYNEADCIGSRLVLCILDNALNQARDIDPLLDILTNSDNWATRVTIIWALSWLGNKMPPVVIEQLTSALSDSNESVRNAAHLALAQSGYTLVNYIDSDFDFEDSDRFSHWFFNTKLEKLFYLFALSMLCIIPINDLDEYNEYTDVCELG